jgi:molybdate transport system substrate-binding protein
MSFIKKAGLLLMVMLILGVCGCGSTTDTEDTHTPVTLDISAAASMTNALEEINALYTQEHSWVTITPNYAASGTLQTQIENGAPCDVFFSAAAKQMNTLEGKGLLLDGTRFNLLTNSIVLIVPKDSTLGLTSFNDLTLDKVKLIAVGDPEFVPAGTYAQKAFTELGVLDALQSKFVMGASVTQVLQYVETGDVDAGITYSTDALSSSNVTVVASGPDSINAQIVYPVSIIKASTKAEAAQEYLEFLKGAQAKAIFEKYGFLMAAS